MNVKTKWVVWVLLYLALSGCVELSYIRPVISDTKPPISIQANKEIQRIARSSDDPVASLIEAKQLPQFQVAQYACERAQVLPDRVNMEWHLLCAKIIVDLIRKQHDVLDGGQTLQQRYNESTARIFTFVRAQRRAGRETLYKDQNFAILKNPGTVQINGFNELLESDNYKLGRFDQRYMRDGFGVPYIGFQKHQPTEPVDVLYPPEGRSYAYTGTVDFKRDPINKRYIAELKLQNPTRVTHVAFGGCEYPLASDFSAPYAYLLSRSSLKQLAWSGFFEFERAEDHLGLFLMQPYDPDKIPLVMIHGLLSSPQEWAQLTNTVLGTDLTRRYQVWHYVYPTSAPFLYSAHILSQRLQQARKLLDPELGDFATNHMVFVAHSMGGLLTKALAIDSESRLWDTAFSAHIEKLTLSPADRKEIRSIFFLEPKPYVKRIVFLGTPHHGSEFADSFFGGIGSSLTRRPVAMKSLLTRVTTHNPLCMTDEMKDILIRGGPTSVKGLSPDHPLTRTFASIPISPNIPFHTIIGSGSGSNGGEISDGIVTYASAYIDGAESEFVFPVKHTKYDEPEVVDAIVGILRLHLDKVNLLKDREIDLNMDRYILRNR